MRKFLLSLTLLYFSSVMAQGYGDGCMRVRFLALEAWNEEYEDPFFNDESNWQWWFADVGNYDGAGWVGGNCLAQGGFFQIGFWNHTDVTIYDRTYGAAGGTAATVPLSYSLRGHYEGDDCGGSCDYCTSLFDDDDYRYDETVSTGINYRFGPPNTFNNFQRFTNWHGSSDYGGVFSVNYTSPRPLVSANNTQICSGSTTAVTLSFSGAVFGGSYVVYDGASIIYNGSGTSFTVNINSSKTYNVYTRNNGVNSLCYSTISINAINCDFNCNTRANVSWNASYDVSQGFSSNTSFTSPGQFPTNSYISDINVDINFLKTDGSCASPASGSAFHNETFFRLNNSTLGSISLVNGNFSGNTALTTPITITFDEDAGTGVSGYNVTAASNGAVLNPIGNLDAWNWNLINPAQTWNLWGGDNVALDPLCTYFYNLTVCGCKTADYGLATVNGSSSNITICADDPGTITLSHNGSANAFDNDGYGDQLRWFVGSCGGSFIGSGMSITLPSPTTTTTYYCSFYIDGVPCRGANNYCESISVNVTPVTVPGTISPVAQTICVSSVPTNLTLAGYTGSILRWEYSSDGGGTWGPATGSSTSNVFSLIPYSPIPGVHTFRAIVSNGVCSALPSNEVTLTVNPNPLPGTVSSSDLVVCSDDSYVLNANGYTGSIQWQVSSTNGTTGFSDIAGETSPSYGTSLTNLGTSDINRWYRIRVANAPCATVVYSSAVQITINPVTVGGVVSGPIDSVCLNGNPGVLSLSGNVGAVQNWYLSYNGAAYTNIANIATNYAPGVLSSAGTYDYVAVVKSGACQLDTSSSFRITVIPSAAVSITGLSEVCEGSSLTLTANPSGGVGVYSYQWFRNGTPVGSNSNTLVTSSSLVPSTYAYTVQLSSGPCTVLSNAFPVTVNPRPTISNISVQNLQCYGVNIGAINIVGVADSFSINNGASFSASNNFTGLSAGSYNIVVKNNFLCTTTYNANPVVITQPDSILINFNIVEPNCATSNDGSIQVLASGGTPPFEYSLNGAAFQNGNSFTSLAPNTYTISVRDANNCIYSKDTTLTAQYTFDLVIDSLKDVSCPGSADGYIQLGTLGGVAPFMFSQDNAVFSSDSVYSSLVAGNYTFYANDVNGCTDVIAATLVESPPVHIELDTVVQLLCNGDNSGEIYVSLSGSTPPYAYEWRLNGNLISTNEDIVGLAAGSYNLTVSTSSSCQATLAVTIVNPPILNVSTIGTTNASCNGLLNGGAM
ncbi:MAG: SprB repeat-containing protein [Chitinophagales bacterium]